MMILRGYIKLIKAYLIFFYKVMSVFVSHFQRHMEVAMVLVV